MRTQTILLTIAGFTLVTLPFALVKAQTHVAPLKTSFPSAVPSVRSLPTDDALRLWQRLRNASGPTGTPVSADVVITSFSATGATRRQVSIRMQEGPGGRYRLTYTAPREVAGRTVIFDGKTLFQYEPTHHVVLKRPVESDAVALIDATGKITDSLFPSIERNDSIAGQPVRILALQDRQARVIRRCYIEPTTGRSLRTEEFDPESGHLLRRVTKTNLIPTPLPDMTLFHPDFPTSARILSASSHRSGDLQGEKNKLGIPVTAGKYRLRTVLNPSPHKSSRPQSDSVHHAIYSNGEHTVSVFVSSLPIPNAKLTPPDGSEWQSVEVTPGARGFAHQDERGRTGVVWLRDGRRYVLAARIPLNDALSLAQALCKNL